MKVKTVSYSKVFSLGNYENEKLGVEIEISDGDDVQSAMQKARNFVEFNHQVNGLVTEQQQCEHIMNNADDFTGNQVKKAKERVTEINDQLQKGVRLLAN